MDDTNHVCYFTKKKKKKKTTQAFFRHHFRSLQEIKKIGHFRFTAGSVLFKETLADEKT